VDTASPWDHRVCPELKRNIGKLWGIRHLGTDGYCCIGGVSKTLDACETRNYHQDRIVAEMLATARILRMVFESGRRRNDPNFFGLMAMLAFLV